MIDLKVDHDHWLLPDGTVTFVETQGTEGSRGVIPAVTFGPPCAGARRVMLGGDYIH